MADIKLCPKCGGKMVPVGERTGGFSGKKAVIGAVVAGPVGVAAGALGKKLVTLQCENCGYTIETNEKTAEKAQWYGEVYGPIEQMKTQMLKENYENQRRLKKLQSQIDIVLKERFIPLYESSGPLLSAEEVRAQRRQERVIAFGTRGESAAAVKSDGTVMLAGKISEEIKAEVKRWKNVIAVVIDSSLSKIKTYGYDSCVIFGIQADGRVLVAYDEAYRTLCANKEKGKTTVGSIFDVKDWTDIEKIISKSGTAIGLRKDGSVVTAGIEGPDVSSWRNIIDLSRGKKGLFSGDCIYGLCADGGILSAGHPCYEFNPEPFQDSYFGNLIINEHYARLVHSLFGEQLLSNWKSIVAIAGCNGCLYAIREDGNIYFASSYLLIPLCKVPNMRPELEENQKIIATSSNYGGKVLFLRSDGTTVYYENYEKPTVGTKWSDWNHIAAIFSVSEGNMRIGLRSDGTIVAEREQDEEKLDGVMQEMLGWKDILVFPEVKERLKHADELKKRKRIEERIELQREEKKKEDQRWAWIKENKCQYCGGSFSFFGRKCKSCGKPKDY